MGILQALHWFRLNILWKHQLIDGDLKSSFPRIIHAIKTTKYKSKIVISKSKNRSNTLFGTLRWNKKMPKSQFLMKIKPVTYCRESVLRLSFFSFLYISLCLKKVPQMGGSRAVLKMCNLPSGLKLWGPRMIGTHFYQCQVTHYTTAST